LVFLEATNSNGGFVLSTILVTRSVKMKRIILLLVLAVIGINLFCAEPDYTTIPPQSLPLYSGSLDDPLIKIVYEDQNGQYVFVEYQGVLYVCYL